MRLQHWLVCAATVVIAGLWSWSCGGRPAAGDETGGKVRVEAYLFDAELRRAGKPTSFRLEIFHTDSVMALSGRGYLGKGALRGRVTPDSLITLFPASDEYLQEAVVDLVDALDCTISPDGLNLVQLIDHLPDSSLLDPAVEVVSNYEQSANPSFIIFVNDCPWQMEMHYKLEQELGWRLEEFTFFDGKDTRLKATRREFKKQARVGMNRFEVQIPADAQRILP